jgi:hypothetical protein
MGKAKRKQKTKMGVDCVVQWKKKKKKKQILSKKKKREGDDEWGEGKEIEKFALKEKLHHKAHFSPTLQFLSQVSTLFVFSKTHYKFEKTKKTNKQTKHICAFA